MKKFIVAFLSMVTAISAVGFAGCGEKACQHSYSQRNYHEATCTEGAYYEQYCAKCGATGENNYVSEARGHGRVGIPTYNNDETCTSNGTQSCLCPTCGETYKEEVPNSARHLFNGQRDCSRCDEVYENKYLKFEKNETENGYIVSAWKSGEIFDGEALNNDTLQKDLQIINIPSMHEGLPVVEIKENGFRDLYHKNVSVYIPSTVKKIGGYAFCNNYYLRNVYFDANSQLETIAESAFLYTGITTLALPEGLQTLGYRALACMERLTCLTLPSTLTEIGDSALNQTHVLNTVIDNSTVGFSVDDLKAKMGDDTVANPYFDVRETNPNRTITQDVKVQVSGSNVDTQVEYTYFHVDGKNILADVFVSQEGQISALEIPYGITQVEYMAVTQMNANASKLVLPASVNAMVNRKNFAWKSHLWNVVNTIEASSYTDLSEVADEVGDEYPKVKLTLRQEEKPVHLSVDLNFAAKWNSIVSAGYVYKENGVTVTFSTPSGETANIGNVVGGSSTEPAHVHFANEGLNVLISLDDDSEEYAVSQIVLRGHNASGDQEGGVKVYASYYDATSQSFVNAISNHAYAQFNTLNNAYSDVAFKTNVSLGKGDWKYELVNTVGYGYSLMSLTFRAETLFNADLTEK